MRQLDIHVVGFEKPPEEVIAGLQRHFGLPRSAALRFVNSVPRVARHCAGYAEAKAYEQALRAVGAVVQLRPAVSFAPAPDYDVPSLPAPPMARSKQPGYDSSAHLAERIPRAPAVPAEAWHKPPVGGFDELGNPLVMRDDLAMSEEFYSDNPLSSAPAEVSSERDDLRLQPNNSITSGLRLSSSPHPGPPSESSFRASDMRTAPVQVESSRPKARGLVGVILALGLASGGLWYFQQANSEDAQLTRAADSAGIDVGDHEPAAAFLSRGTVVGLTNERSRDLLSAAKLTGARAIVAIGIEQNEGGDTARGLLVELPNDPGQRNALLWLQARALESESRITDDNGQRFLVISGVKDDRSGATDGVAGP